MYRYQRYSSGYGFGSSISDAVRTLIIINVAVFLGTHLVRWFPWALFAMTPRLVLSKLMLWQFVTYMFLHADVWHIGINMLMLWFFGPAIEHAWGPRRFLFYYFFTGIGAALGSFIFSFDAPIIGASGAIFGLLVAYAMMFPDTVVLVFFFFPMKIKHAVLFFAGINLLGAVSASGSGIAYVAHLGGALFGYLYLKSEWLKMRLRHFFVTPAGQKKKDRKPKKPRDQELDKKIDEILDKIAQQGIESLTPAERKILEERSKRDS